MKQPRKRWPLKSLSPARQELIVCMHEKQHGVIRCLPIVDGEPIIAKAKVTRKRKLAKEAPVKRVSRNFCLKAPQKRLMATLDEIQNGVLEVINFCDGLPDELDETLV